MTLDLHDLEVFLTVERQGSFGRAATELLVTQPAVSERIRHLERELGRSVFERTPRGATLTTAGECLLPYARRCIELADEAAEAARSADGSQRFTVAVHSTFAPRILPFVLETLAARPLRIAVRDAHSEAVPALVLDGAAHIGIAIPAPVAPGLRRVALPPDPVVCVAAANHPVARARHVSLQSLRGALVALNAWGSGADQFVARLRAAGVEDWRVRHCGDASTALTLARDHGHVAFVATSAIGRDARVRPIVLAGMPPWQVKLDLLYRAADRHDDAVKSLVGASKLA